MSFTKEESRRFRDILSKITRLGVSLPTSDPNELLQLDWMSEYGSRDFKANNMHSAAQLGRLDIIKILLEEGYERYEYTIFFSKFEEQVETVRWLLNNGFPSYKGVAEWLRVKDHEHHISDMTD